MLIPSFVHYPDLWRFERLLSTYDEVFASLKHTQPWAHTHTAENERRCELIVDTEWALNISPRGASELFIIIIIMQ